MEITAIQVDFGGLNPAHLLGSARKLEISCGFQCFHGGSHAASHA